MNHDAADASGNAPDAAKPFPPAWRAYAHLYLPFVTALLLLPVGPAVVSYLNTSHSYGGTKAHVTVVASAALLTYWLGSLIYPTDRRDASPEQAVRFTRRNDLYRAAVLFTYRWLYGTPFNLAFFIGDLLLSYTAGALIGERPAGTKQRRSEFLVAVLWVGGSWILQQIAPPTLRFYILFADRVLWRTAYIALVDDVVGVLTRPDIKTLRGKVILVLTQAFTITFVVWQLLSWQKTYSWI